MLFLFAGLAGLILFVLVIWAGTMVYRLYNPDNPHPFAERPVVQKEEATAQEEQVSVGVREIRADRRRKQRKQSDPLEYVWGQSDGIPESWREDLWTRRN